MLLQIMIYRFRLEKIRFPAFARRGSRPAWAAGGMAGSGKTVAGCRLVAPPVVKPVAGKGACKCRISGLFLFLTTKATEKQKENQSEQKTESRVLCAGFFNVRCQTPLSGSHLPGSTRHTPGRSRPGIFMEVNAYGKTSRPPGAEPEQKEKGAVYRVP